MTIVARVTSWWRSIHLPYGMWFLIYNDIYHPHCHFDLFISGIRQALIRYLNITGGRSNTCLLFVFEYGLDNEHHKLTFLGH